MPLLIFAAICWLNVLLAQSNLALALALALVTSLVLWRFRFRLQLSNWQILLSFLVQSALVLRTKLPESNFQLPSGFAEFRMHISQLCIGISDDAKALVLGITDGDDSGLSARLADQMKELSLTHLTAVSGTNCSILIAASFATFTVLGLRKILRIFATLIVLALYLGLVGNQPSVFRAAAMATIVLLAMLGSNKVNVIASLGLSILILLAIDHSLASDYGFALSALATAGLLILAPVLFQKFVLKLPRWLAMSLAITVSAQAFCLPVLVTLQPEQSSLAILANILAEPVVAIITLLGLAASVLSLISGPLASALFWFSSLPAQYLVAITRFLSSIDGPSVQLGNFIFVLAVILLGVVVAIKAPKFKSIAISVVIFGVLIITASQTAKTLTSNFPLKDWFYISCDVGQGDATVIRSQNKVAVIDVGREPKLIDKCLKRLGVDTVDLLVLTHFDADHVAGLEGAIQGRKVVQALVTSYQDDRPGSIWIQTELDINHIASVKVEKGMNGELGSFHWQVLSPHHNGQDSEDPNDGSITMLWQNQQVNIITLADLGEKGQMRLGEEIASWENSLLHQNPTVVKVSHHGSADQFAELYEWLKPTIATISVGKQNTYGHPTIATLRLLAETSKITLRTDLLGSLAIALDGKNGLTYSSG